MALVETTFAGKCIEEVRKSKKILPKQKSSRFSVLLLSQGIIMLPTIPGTLHLTKLKIYLLPLVPSWSSLYLIPN